jgi:hypothetical protein
VKLEARLDSAFFADKHVNMLDKENVEFTLQLHKYNTLEKG